MSKFACAPACTLAPPSWKIARFPADDSTKVTDKNCHVAVHMWYIQDSEEPNVPEETYF